MPEPIVMAPEEYQQRRASIGTQVQVGELLGVAKDTVSARERGVKGYPVQLEAAMALLGLQLAVGEISAPAFRKRVSSMLATQALAAWKGVT